MGELMVMVLERGDLDGLRLVQAGRPDVWLVYHGVRHRIPSPAVYDALFSNAEGLIEYAPVDEVRLGEEVHEGTCLVQADNGLAIYLLTSAITAGPRLHHIATYDSFMHFGFDQSKVRKVPDLMLNAMPRGADLVSAADRAARR